MALLCRVYLCCGFIKLQVCMYFEVLFLELSGLHVPKLDGIYSTSSLCTHMMGFGCMHS